MAKQEPNKAVYIEFSDVRKTNAHQLRGNEYERLLARSKMTSMQIV